MTINDAKNRIAQRSGIKWDQEEFKRPNHFDYMTSEELKKSEFTGMRHNQITDDIEIWLVGRIEAKVTAAQRKMRSNAVEETVAEVFGLYNVKREGA